MLQYQQVFKQSRPKTKDVELLREWIRRRDLGGGCGFVGRDLGPLHPKVYDERFENDLMMILDRRGEDDAFTQFLTGPVFRAFDRIVRRARVCHRSIFYYSITSSLSGFYISRSKFQDSKHQMLSAQPALTPRAIYAFTLIVMSCGLWSSWAQYLLHLHL
jgi:hypothetical protein